MADSAATQPAQSAGRKFWLGLVISLVSLILAFRGVNWSELWMALRAVDLWIMSLAVGVFVINLVIRGLRWQTLLSPLGPVTSREAFAFLNIGYMANDILPLRAGEVIRSVLLASKKRFDTAAVLATVVVERLMDVLMLVALTFLLLQLMPVSTLIKQSALVTAALAVVGLGLLWWAAKRVGASGGSSGPSRKLRLPVPERILGFDVRKIMEMLLRLVRSFASGLGMLRSARQTGTAASYTLLAWIVTLVYTGLMLRACQLDLPWTATLMVVVVVNLGLAIPSSPGFVGVMHYLAVLALSPWSVEPNAALTFAIVYHGVSFLVTIVLGLVYLWREGLKLTQISINIGQQPGS